MRPSDYIGKFCASDGDIRAHLVFPARLTGKLLASNGHVLICTEDDPDVMTLDDSRLPKMAQMFLEQYPKISAFAPLSIELPPAEPCPNCNGAGRLTACAACKGSGEGEEGREYCGKCGGAGGYPSAGEIAGDEPCFVCDGSKVHPHQTVPIGCTFFACRYLALLMTLPGIELQSDLTDPKAHAYFRFAQGWGALMPCRGPQVTGATK